jgi:diacylglycerol kinase (ATP)
VEVGGRKNELNQTDMEKNRFSIMQRIRSFGFAGAGISAFLRSEHNAWLHFIATIAVIVFGYVTGLSGTEWIAIVVAIALVWVAEMFNTCLEKLIDFLSAQQHPSIKFIKDVAAGAVLVAAIAAATIGFIIFIPHYI